MRMSLQGKLLGSVALVGIALVLVAWRSIAGIRDIELIAQSIQKDDLVPAQKIADAHVALLAWNRGMLSHVMTESVEKMDAYEKVLIDQRADLLAALEELSEMPNLLFAGREIIERLQGHMERAESARHQVIALSRGGDQEEARQLLQADLRPIVDQMDGSMTEFSDLHTKQLDDAVKTAAARYRQVFTRIMWIVGGALILSFALLWLTARNISQSVERLVDATGKISAGDLEHQIDVRSGDEIGRLAGDFNNMAVRLREAQDTLVRHERLAALGELAGGVAHELRNPLGAIKNAAYFLNMALEDPDPEVSETIEILNREVTGSQKILNDLLGFARPQQPNLQKVDINNVVQQALSRAATPENVEVDIQQGEALPTVLGDPDQLSQVFGNIIGNAIQAMPQGGRLLVASAAQSPGRLSVSFADTGEGIRQENMKKIMEPLFTTKAKGIGLGLALARRLVGEHGGSIEVESEVGKGATFTVTLPTDREGRTEHAS